MDQPEDEPLQWAYKPCPVTAVVTDGYYDFMKWLDELDSPPPPMDATEEEDH